jgi:PAS domain S-box-containing protein
MVIERVLNKSVANAECNVTEEALKESEERLRLALSAAEMGTWRLDAVNDRDTRDATLNKMLGLEALTSTQPNSDFIDRIHPDDRAAAEAELVRSVRERDMCKAEFRIIRSDGTIRWLRDQSRPHFNEKGEHIFCAGVVRDITDLKQAEQERDNAMRELEALKNRLEEENIYLKKEIREVSLFSDIIGNSNSLLYVLACVKDVAGTDSTVLVQGETGVGKELVSIAIHEGSLRFDKTLIKVNCAALPENLVESELFGYEPGAFTGAVKLHRGRFELADKGTLFLDEISELSLATQAKLLRVLQDGEFERLGGAKILKTDVRVIAASNQDLNAEVAAGRFRADLFYRLNVYPITVPPLRKRIDDIPLLVEYFVPKIASRIGKQIDRLPVKAMERLKAYDWPGNVRELKNVLERAVIIASDSVLRLPPEFGSNTEVARSAAGPEAKLETMAAMERRHILTVLEAVNWRVSGEKGAAKMLGLNPSTLRSRLKKLNIRRS